VNRLSARNERDASLKWLGLFVVCTIALWQSPLAIVLYPFTLLATWFHEMGHGIAAVLVGAEFDRLVILPDGSGYTQTLRPADMSPFTSAFISAGGPLGPALAGGCLIIASRWKRGSTIALTLLAATMLLTLPLVVRGWTGWIVLPTAALALLALARFGRVEHRQLGLKFMGLQACISTFVSLDYLFSRGGLDIGGTQFSDTEQMARELLLPYWVWGGVLTLTIAAIIAASLWLAYRR
jgi:hypothetical protein